MNPLPRATQAAAGTGKYALGCGAAADHRGRATVRRARLFLETPGRIVRGGIKWYRGMAKGGLWARYAYRLVNMKYLRSNLRPPGLLLAPGTPAGAMEYVPGWPTHDGRRVTCIKKSFAFLDLGAPRKSS